MRKTLLVKVLLYLIIIISSISLAGCNEKTTQTPFISSDITANISSTPLLTTTPSLAPSNEVPMQLIAIQGRLMLIPSPASAMNASGVQAVTFLLSNDRTAWTPAPYSASKIDSVTGRYYRDEQESTYDIYQVKIGDLTGYSAYNSSNFVADMENEIMRCLIQNQPVIQPRSKDYTIMQIFDALYAVGADGILKMISKRKIDSYDYSTISKEGAGDLFAWHWVYQPVCSTRDNLIFYLSSREKQFYSIWELNIDEGIEKRIEKDVALELKGVGAQQLIVIMNPNKSEFYGKMISTSNPMSFVAMTDEIREWQSSNGWLYRRNETNLILKNGEKQVEIDAGSAFAPLLLEDDILWMEFQSLKPKRDYMRIDLKKNVYSIISASKYNSLQGWKQFLTDLSLNEIPFDQAAAHGIKIVLK